MVDLVTALSPHFTRAYIFGAFALVDAGRPDVSVQLLKRGFEENPDEWRFPAYLGYFAYQYGTGARTRTSMAARVVREGSRHPWQLLPYLPRLAAALWARAGRPRKR